MINLRNFEILRKFIVINISYLNEEYTISLFLYNSIGWILMSVPHRQWFNARIYKRTIDWTNPVASFLSSPYSVVRLVIHLIFFFCFSFFCSLYIVGNRYILWHHLAHLNLLNCSFERLFDSSSLFLSHILFQGFYSFFRWQLAVVLMTTNGRNCPAKKKCNTKYSKRNNWLKGT